MSIIFGIQGPVGQFIGENDLREISRLTDQLAPDGTYLLREGNVGVGFQPFYTHERSRLEAQPLADKCGNTLLWDGRLDNFDELASMFDLAGKEIPDSEIVLAAFRRWGETCFSKFVGEWALALSSHADRSLYLVCDHAGTRTLYYHLRGERVLWSSDLKSLVSPSERSGLSDEFVARYLCSIPTGTLTPYCAIRTVPPGHFVRFREQTAVIYRYWYAHQASPLALKTDAEYEENFFGLFRQAVERRSENSVSVLAELSGGMDSSAIVCMSDQLRGKSGKAPSELIDTISYFDSSEPNWDERPFVSVVESRRGKTGIHIDLSPKEAATPPDLGSVAPPALWPQDCHVTSIEPIREHNYRVILSGLGGDELLGGVPTPLPELADLLYRHRYFQLLARSFAWCVSDRKAMVVRLRDVVRFRCSVYRKEIAPHSTIPQWVSESSRAALTLTSDEMLERACSKEMMPSAVSFLGAWQSMLETLPTHARSIRSRLEYRFPYLDRDLVEFLVHVPREQLVRPGRRRSLMRRTLKQIMPAEIIERRRKAFAIRRPVLGIRDHHSRIRSFFERSVAAERGYIDRSRFLAALDEFIASAGIGSHRQLAKAINLERWLRSIEGID